MEKVICVFGNSIAWGAWDAEKGGWVNRLNLYFHFLDKGDNKRAFVHNLAITGNTTNDLLRRFENEAEERFWGSSENKDYKKDNICIFEIGKNDSIYVKTKNKPWVGAEEFENNLVELIKKAGNFSSNIVFLGLAKVDETETIPWEESGESYDNENIEKYNSIIEKVCRKNGARFIAITDLLNKKDSDDGLHPNAAGHEKIFARVRKFLIKNKRF